MAAIYYRLSCPTCARQLNIPVVYLGKQVCCKHCHAQFEAYDADHGEPPPSDSGLGILRRADELLAQCEPS